jgi:hypothetical protein
MTLVHVKYLQKNPRAIHQTRFNPDSDYFQEHVNSNVQMYHVIV